MKTRSLFRTALIGAVALSLTALPASAQSLAEPQAPSKATVEAPKQAPSLVSVEASRVGIVRAEARETANALGAAEMSESTRWIVIIVVAILAAALIMAVVD